MASNPALTSTQKTAFNDALQRGISEKNMDMIKLALDNGAEPTLLLFAGINFKPTWKDHFNYDDPWKIGLDWIKAAVGAGADVQAKKHGGGDVDWPALHWSEDNFNEKIADFLIEKGADVDTPSPYGDTPLMRAVGKGSEELVRYYLKKGADPMKPCGEKKDTFPLKALEDSDKFKKGKKSELLMLMMKAARPADPEAAPAPPPADAGVETAHDMEVSKPLALKAPQNEEPPAGKHFSL